MEGLLRDLVIAGVAAMAGALIAGALAFRRRRAIERAALDRSRAVLKGQIAEQLVPLLGGTFPFHPADARFLGNPIDYVVFDGLSEERDAIEVVLVEVKSGKARLSASETRVRDAITAGRVRFATVRVDPR